MGGAIITWEDSRNGNTDIYAMEVQGGALARLTSHPAADDSPDWSPDGRRLAFVSERDGNKEIYLIGADGSGLERLTDNVAVDDHPVWSPDGKLLAFESDRTGNMDVYVVGIDGSGLTRATWSDADDWMGDWAPDGRRLAILSARDGLTPAGTETGRDAEPKGKVYLVSLHSTRPQRLSLNDVLEGRPIWAPDGQHVYFTWYFENEQVCRTDLSATSIANVTRSPYRERLCDVSSDGDKLLVISDRVKEDELYLIEMSTGAARRLTFNPGPDRDGVFAPHVGSR